MEAARAREGGERGRSDVGGMDLDERLDEVLDGGTPLVLVRLEERRQCVGHDVAVEVLHHVERLSECVFLAESDDARDADARIRERELQPRLAEDVVCRGRERRAWGAPEDEPHVVPLDEEGDVRAPGPDAADPQRPAAKPVLVEEALDVLEHEQRRHGERLGLGGSRDDVDGHGAILSQQSLDPNTRICVACNAIDAACDPS